MRNDKPVISLFSGAMGLDLGLEEAGFRTAVALEKNAVAVETIKLPSNKGPTFPVIEDGIENVPTEKILTEGKLQPSEAFALTGGPCCQSFSTAGKRQSLSDKDGRGMLFRHFKRVISEARPRFFLMENVKGMLSAAVKHRPLDERGPDFDPLSADEQLGSALKVIQDELAELKYYVIFGLVNCADYGVPQKRLRVIFIGSRDGENIALPKPTHAKEAGEGKLAWVTLKDAIGRLRSDGEHIEFQEDRKELLKLLGVGENWRDLPSEELQIKALGGAANTWGGRTGFCRRLAWDKPSPTLTTDPAGRATTLCHPTVLRPLSIEEYARLQQFPKDWKFAGGTRQKYMQIGNAVPTGLGKAIGEMLKCVAQDTENHGLPKDAKSRLGKVAPASTQFAEWLKNRNKTQVHPVWKRKNKDEKAMEKWLLAAA